VQQAKLLAGEDPDWLSRDLREAIERGDCPEWTLAFQYMSESDGYKNPIAFDCTKTWPHAEFPLVEIGTITLNDLPRDYHAEVEQVAFSPANVVPGIDYSPDRLLQGRLFLYDDTQFHRLGNNYKQIPINFPHLVQPQTLYIGGKHQSEVQTKWPHYLGSNYGQTQEIPKYQNPPLACNGPVSSYEPKLQRDPERDLYEQPRIFFQKVLSEQNQSNLCYNLAVSLAKIDDLGLIGKIHSHFIKIDPVIAKTVTIMTEEIRKGQKIDEGQRIHRELREVLSSGKHHEH